MGGSGGGSGGSGQRQDWTKNDVDQLKKDFQKLVDDERAEAEINSAIVERLIDINGRDSQDTREKLDSVLEALSDETVQIETLLFGGSVARHTHVDGLSDVDALVVLGADDLHGRGPEGLREEFADILRRRLPAQEVRDIKVGNMAVTLELADGSEIQLLPAVRRGAEIEISSASGKRWKQIEPAKFARELTRVNQANGGRVVPVIKLAKSAMTALPEDVRLSGYHVEALAVIAFQDYSGPPSYRAMVTHLLEQASRDVSRPLADISGQSKHIDERWGAANSPERTNVARVLRGLAKRANDARTAAQWREIIDPQGN